MLEKTIGTSKDEDEDLVIQNIQNEERGERMRMSRAKLYQTG